MRIDNFQFILVACIGLMSFIPSNISFTLNNVEEGKEDRIYWSEGHKLSWEDFKGRPDYKNNFASAISSTGIVYKYRCENNIISVSVESMFIKSESWVKNSALTNYHLQHEQLHFDITELFARKLRKELSQRVYKCGDEKQLEYNVNKKLKEWNNEQKTYDKQTHHSLDEEKQYVWNDLIQDALISYSAFSSKITYD